MELHRWVTGIRMVKNGAQICDNYRDILEDMDLDAHQDYLDNNYIVTRYVTEEEEKLLTPTSETDQNSFDSGVSSRAASDISDIKTKGKEHFQGRSLRIVVFAYKNFLQEEDWTRPI